MQSLTLKMTKVRLSILSMIFVSFAQSAYSAIAPAITPNAPLEIRADKATIEQTSRQATYLGNVIMTQGAHELKADKLEIKQSSKGGWEVIRATGNPAHFSGTMESSPQPVYGTAKTIYYYPDKQLVVLEGNATLNHIKDKFQGPSLSYSIDKKIISAIKQSDERPTITISPRA